MVYTLLCLRKHSQQTCFGFGTGVWISLWGLEDVCFVFMGQHLCKFVPDVEGLLQKCLFSGNPGQNCRSPYSLLDEVPAPSRAEIRLCSPFAAYCATLFKSHANCQRVSLSRHLFCFGLGQFAGKRYTQLCKMFVSVHLPLVLLLVWMDINLYPSASPALQPEGQQKQRQSREMYF